MSLKLMLLISFCSGFVTCWIGEFIHNKLYEKHTFGRSLKFGESVYCGEDGIWHFENKRRFEK